MPWTSANIITTICILLNCSGIIFGQIKDLSFQHISVKEGLSQSTVHCILQDKTGLMWIGTQNGLDRYDGYEFINFVHNRADSNSISNNYINAIFQDESGLIWIGTDDGLNVLPLGSANNKGEIFYKFKNDSNNSYSLSSNVVEAIYQDKDGYIWIGTVKGLNKIHLPNKKHFTREDFLNINFERYYYAKSEKSISNNYIKSIIEDGYGNIWIGTLGGGLNKYDKKSGKFFHFKNNPANPNSISSNYVITLFIDRSDNLWVGTYDGGLNKFDPLSQKFVSYKNDQANPMSISDNHVYSIQEDLEGNLWLATFGGINVFDPGTKQFFAYKNTISDPKSLSNNFVRCLFMDNSRNLWAGTNNGIDKADLKPAKFLAFQRNPNKLPTFSSSYTLSFYEDKSGILWIGTIKGLDKYNIKKDEVTNFKILHNQTKSREGFVYGIEQGGENILWLGSFGGGLYKFNTKTNSIKQFKHNPYDAASIIDSRIAALFTDHKGNLLLGTLKGICIFEKDKEKVMQDAFALLENIRVSVIYQDKKNNYWIGTYSGVYLFDEHRKFIAKYESEHDDIKTISSNIIYSICEDQKGNIWIGTDNGLNKINNNHKVINRFFKEDGLPSNSIASIIKDKKGNLWISTFKGISMLDPELNKIEFHNYGLDDGLASLELTIGASFKNKKGEIYFGSLNGFNKFDPSNIYHNPYPPNVIITKFSKFNKLEKTYYRLRNQNYIELAYNEQFFSFEFSSLDFTNPSKNKYKYILEGFDKDWTNAGNRKYANYTNLDPGEYIFKVKGTNNDGIWSNDAAKIAVIISPPFWAAWWFRALAFFCLAGAVGFVYKRRISNLEKEKKTQEEFSKRLIQSQEEERKRIASELHDSLGQNLLIIKNRAALGLRSDNPGFGKEQLNEISTGASSAIDEVRRIAYDLHPYQLDRLGLTKAIKSILNQVGDLTEIHFTDSIENIDNIFNKENEINIYRIVQECINNILKHSSASEAEIKIYTSDNKLIITIFDNGKGFDIKISSNNPKGFGMSSISKRINILKGDLNIRSGKSGTNVAIRIPLNNNG